MASGCVTSVHLASASATPVCETAGRAGSPPVLLMAQSVPTATLLPCVSLLPAGWSVANFRVRDGRASFGLASDRAGMRAVKVVLVERCTTGGATRVPTDEPGTTRYEKVVDLDNGYTGTRYYLFAGGCVRYDFHLTGDARAVPVNEASLAVSFVARQQIRDDVRDDSDGRLHLDPCGGCP
jgi:hypothetical protein